MIIKKIKKNIKTWFFISDDSKVHIIPFWKNNFLGFKDLTGTFDNYRIKRTSLYSWKINKLKQFDFIYLNLYLNEITFINLFKNATNCIKEINEFIKNNKKISTDSLKILLKKYFKDNISEDSLEYPPDYLESLSPSLISPFEEENSLYNNIPIIEDKKIKKTLLNDLRNLYKKEIDEISKVWRNYKNKDEIINEKINKFYMLNLDKKWTLHGNELKKASQINLKDLKEDCYKEFIQRFKEVDYYNYHPWKSERIYPFIHKLIEFSSKDVLLHKYITDENWKPYDKESINKNNSEILTYKELNKIIWTHRRSANWLFLDLHANHEEKDYFKSNNKKLDSRSERHKIYLYPSIEDESYLFLLGEQQSKRGLIYNFLIEDFLNNNWNDYINFDSFFYKYSNNEIQLYINKIKSLLKTCSLKSKEFEEKTDGCPKAPFLILTKNTQRILSRLDIPSIITFLKNVFNKIKEKEDTDCILLLDYNHIYNFDVSFFTYLSFIGWLSILWQSHLTDTASLSEEWSIYEYIHSLNIFNLIEVYLENLWYLSKYKRRPSLVESLVDNYWDSYEKKYNFLILFICYHLRKENILNNLMLENEELTFLETDNIFSIIIKIIFKSYNLDFLNININNWSFNKLIENCLNIPNTDIKDIYNLFVTTNLNWEENFIINLDVETTLCVNQERYEIWNEIYYNPLLFYLRRNRDKANLRKSEIFKELYFDEDYNNLEKEEFITTLLKDEKLLNKIIKEYLNNFEIYETENEIAIEYDWIRELLTMGVAPQASCQNITKETGYNHKILATALLPYTKLILFFKKPFNSWKLKEINLENKEFIFEKDSYKLKATGRSLLILKGTDKNLVEMKRIYGSWFKRNESIKSFYSNETFTDFQEYLTNKYSFLKEYPIEKFYQQDEIYYGDDFIYIDY